MTKEMLRNLDVGPAFVEALDVRERKTLGVSVDSAWRLARRSRAAGGIRCGKGRPERRAAESGDGVLPSRIA